MQEAASSSPGGPVKTGSKVGVVSMGSLELLAPSTLDKNPVASAPAHRMLRGASVSVLAGRNGPGPYF